jgi:hypothetical protein
MSVLINSTTIQQPTSLREEYVQIQSENQAIAGGLQRNRIGQKKQATLTYDMVAPTQYQQLIAAFTTGSGCVYYNDQASYSGGVFTFSGLPYFSESEYVPGASLYRPFTVRIREQ